METGLPITDLHCHILPGIDDGAQDITVTRALLEEEKKQGVTQIVFTPHFYAEQKTRKQFETDRYNAAVQTDPILQELGITWSAGAEVRMQTELLDMDLKGFRYVDTQYLLLEWPFTQYPLWGNEIVQNILDSHMIPIFAHVERYPYFWGSPESLTEYIEAGVLCQVNAGAVIHETSRKQALKLIQEGYVHILASDAHSMTKRPPRLAEALRIVEEELGRKFSEELIRNADLIFHGAEVTPRRPGKRKFGLF